LKWYAIIHPGIGVSTREVFQSAELTRNSPVSTIRALLDSGGRNDCERVVRVCVPEVAEALDWLEQFAPAHLTGTGSCVFAVCESAAQAERLAARVPDRRWMSFVARGLNVSPMHERLSHGRRG
jgi:4-diphosphocytidyl-2-C-methyl-D-erythritol kinase